MKSRIKSLRGRIFIMMAAIALIEGIVLIGCVYLSGVFTQLDGEAYRFFENDAAERAISFENKTGVLIHNITYETNTLAKDAQEIADAAGIPASEIYLNDEAYNLMAQRCARHLIEFLSSNNVSGAFFILNGSNANAEDKACHSAVYIIDNAPGFQSDDNSSMQLEVGPLALTGEYGLTVSNSWTLDTKFDATETGAYDFYYNPIVASAEYPKSELVRYGYWAPPNDFLEGRQSSVLYTLPILDADGEAYGVVGFQIALPYFTKEYFSNTNLPYNNSFYAVTSGGESEIDTDWVIPGNPMAQSYLVPNDPLHVQPVEGTGLYSAELPGLGVMYCTIHPLDMYSKNSPFADQQWILAGLVQQNVLNEISAKIRNLLYISMAVTLGIAFVAIFLLTFISTRKISGLSSYVNSLTPGVELKFEKTQMTEIDDLTEAVERLNKRVMDSTRITSKMLELTQLPLGGFEISPVSEYVNMTSYIHVLLHLKKDQKVTVAEWQNIYNELTSQPAEGYTDVYRYDSKRYTYSPYGSVLPTAQDVLLKSGKQSDAIGGTYQFYGVPDSRQKWLRIIETKSKDETIGMILDVTSDIEECMRLAHELDYDALTHLYNRTAFKREAFKKIQNDPDKVGAMIFSDLDNLKYMNDTFGHQMGDKLITGAADMFRKFSEYGGIVARISGDEFAIFLYGFDSKEEVMDIVHRLYKEGKEKQLSTPDGKKHTIHFSSGIAWYPYDSQDVADLLKLSDYAMYEAKHNNKGTLFEFNEESYQKNEEKQKSREAITKLLDEKLFRFAFQPIVDLSNSKIIGYEALMRPALDYFKDSEEVIDVARKQSKINQMESVDIASALRAVKENAGEIDSRLVFINSIPGQMLPQREVRMLAEKYSDIIGQIVIELTEEENNDSQKMSDKLQQIRHEGIKIAIDDFGEGYSNETRIIAMMPDIVKIDLALIKGIHDDPEKQEAVRRLTQFCHSEGIRMVAEGVEDAEDLETVMRLGMDYAQGFLLAEPDFEFHELSEDVLDLLRKTREEAEEDGDAE